MQIYFITTFFNSKYKDSCFSKCGSKCGKLIVSFSKTGINMFSSKMNAVITSYKLFSRNGR